jgi:uncharacterized membrane protein YkvA (DUF1232 family)
LYRESCCELDLYHANCIRRFVKKYIEHAPALLDDLIQLANRAGIYKEIQPIIEVAVEYFLSPLDVIPDDLGLFGLLDDAYLTHRLIQRLVDNFQSKADKPLLPPELNDANSFIRKLIGEPQATILDNAVTYNFKPPAIQRVWADIFQFSTHLIIQEDSPIWEIVSIKDL